MKKKKNRFWQQQDPEAQREADRYVTPVPSRTYIKQYLKELGKPVSAKVLSRELELYDQYEKHALRSRLDAMVRDGDLIKNRRNDYCLTEKTSVIVGTVLAKRDGFGFLLPDSPDQQDIYLSSAQMASLMDGDRVGVRINRYDRDGRVSGTVVEVLERKYTEIVGRLCYESGSYFVEAANKRLSNQPLLIPRGGKKRAKTGQVVVADIVEYPGHHSPAIGKISRVLGDYAAPGMEIETAIQAYDLPHEWPRVVLKEAKAFPARVPAKAKTHRLDVRRLPLVTIDGEDARDFDDAVYCEPRQKGWRVLVAIADVASYVKKDSAIDQEARKRGTSVYFTRRVLPMLPETLSNGLCSLNPKVDRLCMICEMHVNPSGKVVEAKFHNGVMRSRARLTYTEVAAALDPKQKTPAKTKSLMPQLKHLQECYEAFLRARKRRGAIEFEMPQTYMVLGEDRRVERIETYERNVAHRIIEECMIAANVEAAKFLSKHKFPTLYRVHDGPVDDRLEELRGFLMSLGLNLPSSGTPQPRDFAKLLRQISQRPDVAMIETVMLRSLARAQYQPKNLGHFGLALPKYVHFTSPIRRYPDLLVHRAIKAVLAGEKPRKFAYSFEDMDRLGNHCSKTERRADEATRDATEWLKCEFMRDKIGQEFDAMITGVTNFGLFVQLKDLQIEGLVHISTLSNDYYDFDALGHRLVGERSGIVYRLTDSIRVRLISVNTEDRKIDFEPVWSKDKKASRNKKSGKHKRRRK